MSNTKLNKDESKIKDSDEKNSELLLQDEDGVTLDGEVYVDFGSENPSGSVSEDIVCLNIANDYEEEIEEQQAPMPPTPPSEIAPVEVPEKYRRAYEFLLSIGVGTQGELPEESLLDLVNKGLDYEQEILRAQKRGEIQGRNIGISRWMNARRNGDGIPNFNGERTVSRTRRSSNSIFALARSAN